MKRRGKTIPMLRLRLGMIVTTLRPPHKLRSLPTAPQLPHRGPRQPLWTRTDLPTSQKVTWCDARSKPYLLVCEGEFGSWLGREGLPGMHHCQWRTESVLIPLTTRTQLVLCSKTNKSERKSKDPFGWLERLQFCSISAVWIFYETEISKNDSYY